MPEHDSLFVYRKAGIIILLLFYRLYGKKEDHAQKNKTQTNGKLSGL